MAKPNGAGTGPPVTESRAESFMRSALDILGETGGTDFTVLDVVQRSKTSLRAFYQHFSTKDEPVGGPRSRTCRPPKRCTGWSNA